MIASRRNLLLGTAGVAAFASMGQLAGCSTTTVLPTVLDAIQQAIAGACKIVPVIATLVDVIVSVFPGAAGVASITDALANQIATYVCNLFSTAGLVEGTHPGRKLTAKVGANNTSVELHCFMVVGGKLTFV